jgi:hypothetical protein
MGCHTVLRISAMCWRRASNLQSIHRGGKIIPRLESSVALNHFGTMGCSVAVFGSNHVWRYISLHHRSLSLRVANTFRNTAATSGRQPSKNIILATPNITSCIFGTTRLGNLSEIVEAANKTIFSEHRKAIATAYRRHLDMLTSVP